MSTKYNPRSDFEDELASPTVTRKPKSKPSSLKCEECNSPVSKKHRNHSGATLCTECLDYNR